MKKIYFLSLMVLAIALSAFRADAQTNYTKQIIFVNGGDFGNADDYVTVASYDLETQTTNEFATIYTQSVQDVIINDGYAYVAAQDSIVKLNIDTYEKVASVAASGINQLATDGNVLIASFWYPVTENFVRIFSLDDLTLISNIEGVSGEAAGILINDGVALVAVPGGWGSTTGKIAAIDIAENTLLSEDDYGDFYAGIGYFAYYNDIIFSFMKTAWGDSTAKVASFDNEGNVLAETTFTNAVLANGTGQFQDKYYVELNNGIAAYDMNSDEMNMIVDPQAASIAASTIDTLNNMIYLTTSDFFSSGDGFIYDLGGTQTGLFDAGISAQAIAVDYRLNSGTDRISEEGMISLFPNPATDFIRIKTKTRFNIQRINIVDVMGSIVYQGDASDRIDISNLDPGVYFINIMGNNSRASSRFIKN
ncbi:MAG: T9SS type A sorting domain-containing protein [Chlorobi bacterium]|nr:T9SS type A sorting domain-containing protein [Chlorobiota bacterium]